MMHDQKNIKLRLYNFVIFLWLMSKEPPCVGPEPRQCFRLSPHFTQ